MSKFAAKLGLFRRGATEPTHAGPPPAEMRGRAAEISDPGELGWEVVWEALKTEPPTDDPSTITQELGLDHEQEIWGSYNSDRPGTEFSGTRHGRRVALRMGVIPGIRGKGFNEVHVAASVASFQVRDENGRLVAQPGALSEVEEVLAGLAPAPETWRDLEVDGGPDKIVARRPVKMRGNQQGYVYDLWLAERLADRLGS